MRSAVVVIILFLVSMTACTVDESCGSHDEDRCEAAVAVTCRVPTSNGSGFGAIGGYDVERVRCTSGVCGKSCVCFKECDICEPKLLHTVACDPDPASCEQSCT
jgi:hypothetical protein